jgi:hypothetical protein
VGSQFVPAQYHAWVFKRFMQDTVEAAVATRRPPAWVEQQLRQNFEDNAIPEDASVEVARDGKHLRAGVRYAQTISLLVTEYEYEHDVTVRSVTTLDGTL